MASSLLEIEQVIRIEFILTEAIASSLCNYYGAQMDHMMDCIHTEHGKILFTVWYLKLVSRMEKI